MRARLLLSNHGETVVCSRCDGGGHFGAPSRFPTCIFCVGCWRPYRRPLPFAVALALAMVVVFRFRCDLFSFSVVGGRSYCFTQQELYSVSAPYHLLSPSFGAIDFVGRSRRELYSVSVFL